MTSSYESKPLRDENRNRRDADSRGPPPPPPPAGGEEPSSSRGRGGGGIGRRKENDDDNKRGHRFEDRDHHSSRGGRSRSRDRRDYDRDYDRGRRRDHDRHHHDNRRGGGGGGGDDDDDRRNHRDRSRGGRDRRDSGHYGPDRGSETRSPSNRENGRTVFPYYKVVKTPADEKLGGMNDDPRGEDPTKRITKKASSRGAGRNTESFDPASTLVRPDLRVQIGSSRIETYNKPLKHDDVVIVPELFGAEEDWDIYYKLVEEMRALQAKEEEEEKAENSKIKEDEEKSEMIDKEAEHKDGKVKKEDRNKHLNNQRNGNRKGGRGGGSSAKWISWHEGAHLISKNPKGCPTYEKIVARLCEYFNIDPKGSVGTRFNWYRDSSDWKPFHHDSAAFNPQRAKNQNITVGASFGAMRELAFIRASEEVKGDSKCRLYFPQSNNGVFSFGRDANIHWKHGVNALAPDEQDGKGRISIILWGLAKGAIEEEGSPPLLGADGKGPHAMARNGGRGGGGGGGGRNNRRNGRR